MKRTIIFFILLILLVGLTSKLHVSALDYSRNVCSAEQYEVVSVGSDGSINNIGCYGDYNSASTVMNNYNSTVNSVSSIIYGGTLIDTEYGLLNLKTKSSSYTTDLFKTADTGTAYTYTNGNYGADAAYLGLNISNSRAKLKISGFTGWVNKVEVGQTSYEVVPISLVKSATYYTVSGGDLRHYFASDIKSTNSYMGGYVNLGPAPQELRENGKYYSFDGNYFYNDLITMLNDYKNNTFQNSVNVAEAYYNYYMFLPYRTKTNYSAGDINDYFTLTKGFSSKPTAYPALGNQSMMYGEGANFIYSQDAFGANAMLTVGLAANESAWGTSNISISKNNLFGHGASDGNPYGDSNGYDSVRNSILYHADYYINSGYCDTKTDSRYYGCHFGNKNSGMNIKYASDPYWGEKMAGHYYAIDKALSLKDYKSYTIGLKMTEDTVNVYKEANTSSGIIYGLNNTYRGVNISSMPVVILGEVTGQSVNGNNIWYKIQTDSILDSSRNAISNPASRSPRPTYDWNNNYGYVSASSITKLGEYIIKQGMYYFNTLAYNKLNNTFEVSGFLAIKGMNNYRDSSASYNLILKNKDTNEEYVLPLDRWLAGEPFIAPGEQGYDYSGSWFKGNVDLSGIPEGDYEGYIRARINGNETKTKLRNVFVKDMTRKVVVGDRGYQFRINYYKDDVPIELFIRDNSLISSSEPPTTDNMFVAYSQLNFNNDKLNIKGTSFNVGIDYGTNIDVQRQIIFENVSTYERTSYDVGYTDSGDYNVTLRVPDGMSKTRAWFDASLDISTLNAGTYAIYVKTTASGFSDYGELNDIFYRSLPNAVTINGKRVSLVLNEAKRNRIELVIE